MLSGIKLPYLKESIMWGGHFEVRVSYDWYLCSGFSEASKHLEFGVFLRVLVAIGSGRAKLVHRGSIFYAFPSLMAFNAEKYCLMWMTDRCSRGLLVKCAMLKCYDPRK